MSPIRAIVSDFGGVLTTPLAEAFAHWQDTSGIPLEALGKALQSSAEQRGENPLFALERGEMSEREFLEILSVELEAHLGRPVEMHVFSSIYFDKLEPNPQMIEALRGWQDRGLRLALCTNNVQEWEPIWRPMLPVDELFELVVDSGFVGTRKPERRIYDLVLEGLELPAQECVFIDDLEHNITAANELGFHGVHFVSTQRAIDDVELALAGLLADAGRAREAWAGWNAGTPIDFDIVHPDIEVHSTIVAAVGPSEFRGHSGLQAWSDELRSNFSQWDLWIDRIEPFGERLLVTGGVDAVGQGSGVQLRTDITWLVRYEDGLLRELRAYFDPAEARAAAQAAP